MQCRSLSGKCHLRVTMRHCPIDRKRFELTCTHAQSRNCPLDQSQESCIASPRNHRFLRKQGIKNPASERMSGFSLPAANRRIAARSPRSTIASSSWSDTSVVSRPLKRRRSLSLAANRNRLPMALALARWQVVRQRILIWPFPGSNPGAPASQCGLGAVVSGCGRTVDISEG